MVVPHVVCPSLGANADELPRIYLRKAVSEKKLSKLCEAPAACSSFKYCQTLTVIPPSPSLCTLASIIRPPAAHLSPTSGGRNLFRMTDSLADKTFAFAPTGSLDTLPFGPFGLRRRAVSEGRSGRCSGSRSGGGSGTVGLGHCSRGGSSLTSASSDGYLLRHVSVPSAGDIGEWYV